MCGTPFWKDERSWCDSKQKECLRRSSPPKGSLKNMLSETSQNLQENICAGISLLVFSCEFVASDYSSINSSKGIIGKRNCKLWYKNWSICSNLSKLQYSWFEPEVQVIKKASPGERTGFRSSCSQTLS